VTLKPATFKVRHEISSNYSAFCLPNAVPMHDHSVSGSAISGCSQPYPVPPVDLRKAATATDPPDLTVKHRPFRPCYRARCCCYVLGASQNRCRQHQKMYSHRKGSFRRPAGRKFASRFEGLSGPRAIARQGRGGRFGDAYRRLLRCAPCPISLITPRSYPRSQ
jgi:hypothetical protein